LKQRSEKSLKVTEMDFCESRSERIRNEQIEEIMYVRHTVVEDIHVAQLKWYGHVQSMGEERLPKKILNGTPQGRRKRGRPRKI